MAELSPRSTPTNYQLQFDELFTRPSGVAFLYHDEIWPELNREVMTGHGVLYVMQARRQRIYERLHEARQGYGNEIGAKLLSAGPRGALYEVARQWVSIALEELGDEFAFKAAFTNHEADWFRAPYKGDPGWTKHLAHSTCLPVLGVPMFALRAYERLIVHPVFDETGNMSDRRAFQAGLDLAARRAARRREIRPRHYPLLDVSPIQYVSSDPRGYQSAETEALRVHSEFIQLVDLLVGALRATLLGSTTNRRGRLMLGASVVDQMHEMWGSPWYRFAVRARSLTVTVWPDAYGLPYNPRPVKREGEGGHQLIWGLDPGAAT